MPDLSALPSPPAWSLAAGAAGKGLVWVAAACFAAAFLLPFLRKPAAERWQGIAFRLGALCLFGVIAILGSLFVQDRFEWEYVRSHSDRITGTAYKIASIWSGQQGSFLLWAVMSAIFGWLTLGGAGKYRPAYVAVYSLFLAALSGILAFETPFELIQVHGRAIVPEDGQGLVPSLLNYWVIIHPPTIFAGFGSLTVPFAYAVAALVSGDGRDWIGRVRPWALLSLALLGLGLCMGGFWAYETLGWGGFWAWDPVENTSFVPWALAAVFAHGMLVQQARQAWVRQNVLFGALPFIAFLYGTFLTRSGYLGDTSVHSFAEMDRSALRVLIGVGAVFVVGFAVLWFARARLLDPGASSRVESWLNRTLGHGLGNWMLALLALVAAIGMSVPLIMTLAGRSAKVVEEWLYHAAVPYFFVPLMLLLAIGPFLGWRRTDPGRLGARLYPVFCLTIALAGISLWIVNRTHWAGAISMSEPVTFPFGWRVHRGAWVMFLAGLCYFALVGNLWRAGELWRASKLGLGGFLSHAGVAVLMAGLILSRGLEQKKEFFVQEGTGANALGYFVTAGPHTTDDIKRRDNQVSFEVARDGRTETLRPGLYYTMMGGEMKPMTWPAIRHSGLHDLYLALHAMELNATEPLRMKPGETKALDRFDATYERLIVDGEPGKAGAKFGALLRLQDRETGEEWVAKPQVMLAEGGGLDFVPALVGSDYFVTAQGMTAETQEFVLQLHFRRPLYWAELFVKPFTILVWVGTGILTLGTLMAAWYRRRPPAPDSGLERPDNEPRDEPRDEDAIAAPA